MRTWNSKSGTWSRQSTTQQKLLLLATFCLLPAALHSQAASVANPPKDLGGPVIDPTTETQVSGFQNQVNAAIAACPPSGCTIDMRPYKTTVEFTSTTTFPRRANVILPYSWSLASGVSLVHSGGHLQGDSVFGSQGVKVNQTTDYTPYITTPGGIDSGGGQVGGEIDHIYLGTSTSSSTHIPIANTSSATCPGRSGYKSCTTYTTVSGYTFPGGACNCSMTSGGIVGRHFHIISYAGGAYSNGDWLILASTSTTIITDSPSASIDGPQTFATASISRIYASGGTVSIAINGQHASGMSVTLSGLTNNTALNGMTVQMLDAGNMYVSGVYSHWIQFGYSGSITPGTETGTATATSGYSGALDGGWGIAGTFMSANIHDVLMYNTDLGLLAAQTGCNCYNNIHDNTIFTTHGAMLLSGEWNANTVNNNQVRGNDQRIEGYANATDFGVAVLPGTGPGWFMGNDSENTRWPYFVIGQSNTFWAGNNVENDATIGQGESANSAALVLTSTSYHNWFAPGMFVLDLSSPSGTNTYGGTWARQNPLTNGSFMASPISITNISAPSVGSGSGSTAIPYWIEGIDFNGNKTMPYLMGSVSNQALGPFTLSLTGVTQSAGVNTYAGTITGGASNGLTNTQFTISGFVNAGNNLSCTPTATTATTIVCKAASGVTESASARAAGVAKNRIGAPTIIGTKCVNILKGNTSALWQSCLYNFPGGSVYDDGSIPTGANVPNATDQTGLVSGATLGTASNCASAASPAVCGSAASGSVVIAASATRVVVETTAITPNSQIQLTEDESLGSRLGVTCNTQALTTLGNPRVTARLPAISFTISIDKGPTTNPMCVSYSIIN